MTDPLDDIRPGIQQTTEWVWGARRLDRFRKPAPDAAERLKTERIERGDIPRRDRSATPPDPPGPTNEITPDGSRFHRAETAGDSRGVKR